MVLVVRNLKNYLRCHKFFDTLDLDSSQPQTLVLDQNEDQHSLSFVNYSDKIKHIEKLAGDLQNELNTKYTPTSILYFNPKRIMMLQFLIIRSHQMLKF